MCGLFNSSLKCGGCPKSFYFIYTTRYKVPGQDYPILPWVNQNTRKRSLGYYNEWDFRMLKTVSERLRGFNTIAYELWLESQRRRQACVECYNGPYILHQREIRHFFPICPKEQHKRAMSIIFWEPDFISI